MRPVALVATACALALVPRLAARLISMAYRGPASAAKAGRLSGCAE